MAGINFNSTDNKVSTGGGSSNVTQSEFTAGEALTAGNALCFFENTGQQGPAQNSGDGSGVSINSTISNEKVGQRMDVGAIGNNGFLEKIVVSMRKTGSPTGTTTMKVYTDQGITLVATSDGVDEATLPTSYTDTDFTFDSTYNLSPSTTYYFALETTRSVGGGAYSQAQHNAATSPNQYNITNLGVWNQQTEALKYSVKYTDKSIVKADANVTGKETIIGFANETVSSGEAVNVNTAGVDDNQSSLTTNTTYYLSDTAGAISSTPGTTEVEVGKAVSDTELAINLFSGGGGGITTSYAFANMTGRSAGGDHTLTNGYKTVDADYTINSTNITVNFDGYVNVRTLISMGTIDNDTNFGLALHKNGTDQGTSTLATYVDDETDTFTRFPMYGEWTLSVADGDTLSIRGEVVSSLDTGKFTVKRVA